MQRLGTRGLVCAGVCLLMATTALAQGQGQGQGRGRGRGGFGRGGFSFQTWQLVGLEPVQKELKLSDEQKEKIKTLSGEMFAGGGGGFGGGRGARGGGGAPRELTEEEQKEFQKRMEEGQKRIAEGNKKIEESLSPEQLKRAKEIAIQINGIGANLQNEEIAKALNITDEQKDQIKTISEETGKRMMELFQPGKDPEEMRKAGDELRTSAEEEYKAVLSDEQNALLDKMAGPKFDVDRRTLFPGFGGRGGQGGGGGGRGRRGGGNNGGPNT